MNHSSFTIHYLKLRFISMKLFFFFVLFFCTSSLYAQRSDSAFVKKDTFAAKKIKKLAVEDSFPNPKRALLYSIIPGGGQIYNRKLWFIKLPVVYGGLAFGIYKINQNSRQYNNLKLNYLTHTCSCLQSSETGNVRIARNLRRPCASSSRSC